MSKVENTTVNCQLMFSLAKYTPTKTRPEDTVNDVTETDKTIKQFDFY